MEEIRLLAPDEERHVLQKYRLLVEEFHPNSHNFEFCNGYILQATRNGLGFKELKGGLVLYTKKQTGEWVIVSAAGKYRAEMIKEVARDLYKDSRKKVIIKNVDKDLETDLLPACRQYRVDEWWDELAKYDDNTFPELVLNTHELSTLTGSKYQSLREEKNRFDKEYSIEVKAVENLSPERISSLLDKWVDDMHLRNDWNKEELHASHTVFSSPFEGLFHYEVLDSTSGKLIGFLVFSEISQSCLGYNVLVNDFSYRNLYRVLMLKGAEIAMERGYKCLNIQGSEDADQYASKLRLKPEIRIFKEHLVYEETK